MEIAASYWTTGGSRVHCKLCPHHCSLSPGSVGTCGVRKNENGSLTLPYACAISSTAFDPIEKKPLYHYHPGETVFSVGFLGCNLQCPFCQNYSISQSTHRASRLLQPAALVDEAVESDSFGIAYTYNEPTIHFEFVREAASIARKRGLKNIIVSNGQLLAEPARELLAVIDAANIDLKCFDRSTYRRVLGGDLLAVKEFITLAASACHVEVTMLLVPGLNNSDSEVRALAAFVADINRTIPLHISAYYPTYQYSAPATSAEQVEHAVKLARESLEYVYAGNISAASETRCKSCGSVLVTRQRYRTSTSGLADGRCAQCGKAAPIVLT